MTVRTLTLALLALGGVVWLAAIVSTPSVLHASRDDTRWNGVATLTYVVGAVICHQRPERSFHTAGIKWPVCSRCTGLYAGAAVALLLWPIVRRVSSSRAAGPIGAVEPTRPGERLDHLRRWRVMTLGLAAPTMITLATATLGWFDPPNAWRAALALPLGLVAGSLLAAVVLGDL